MLVLGVLLVCVVVWLWVRAAPRGGERRTKAQVVGLCGVGCPQTEAAAGWYAHEGCRVVVARGASDPPHAVDAAFQYIDAAATVARPVLLPPKDNMCAALGRSLAYADVVFISSTQGADWVAQVVDALQAQQSQRRQRRGATPRRGGVRQALGLVGSLARWCAACTAALLQCVPGMLATWRIAWRAVCAAWDASDSRLTAHACEGATALLLTMSSGNRGGAPLPRRAWRVALWVAVGVWLTVRAVCLVGPALLRGVRVEQAGRAHHASHSTSPPAVEGAVGCAADWDRRGLSHVHILVSPSAFAASPRESAAAAAIAALARRHGVGMILMPPPGATEARPAVPLAVAAAEGWWGLVPVSTRALQHLAAAVWWFEWVLRWAFAAPSPREHSAARPSPSSPLPRAVDVDDPRSSDWGTLSHDDLRITPSPEPAPCAPPTGSRVRSRSMQRSRADGIKYLEARLPSVERAMAMVAEYESSPWGSVSPCRSSTVSPPRPPSAGWCGGANTSHSPAPTPASPPCPVHGSVLHGGDTAPPLPSLTERPRPAAPAPTVAKPRRTPSPGQRARRSPSGAGRSPAKRPVRTALRSPSRSLSRSPPPPYPRSSSAHSQKVVPDHPTDPRCSDALAVASPMPKEPARAEPLQRSHRGPSLTAAGVSGRFEAGCGCASSPLRRSPTPADMMMGDVVFVEPVLPEEVAMAATLLSADGGAYAAQEAARRGGEFLRVNGAVTAAPPYRVYCGGRAGKLMEEVRTVLVATGAWVDVSGNSDSKNEVLAAKSRSGQLPTIDLLLDDRLTSEAIAVHFHKSGQVRHTRSSMTHGKAASFRSLGRHYQRGGGGARRAVLVNALCNMKCLTSTLLFHCRLAKAHLVYGAGSLTALPRPPPRDVHFADDEASGHAEPAPSVPRPPRGAPPGSSLVPVPATFVFPAVDRKQEQATQAVRLDALLAIADYNAQGHDALGWDVHGGPGDAGGIGVRRCPDVASVKTLVDLNNRSLVVQRACPAAHNPTVVPVVIAPDFTPRLFLQGVRGPDLHGASLVQVREIVAACVAAARAAGPLCPLPTAEGVAAGPLAMLTFGVLSFSFLAAPAGDGGEVQLLAVAPLAAPLPGLAEDIVTHVIAPLFPHHARPTAGQQPP
eukprot:TRINITY_DN30256_c0_g1_i1.p1 TRINITY_DN30256_c0_g1~~TRINITY_DN30256_c0_g1_i1.p1  ORF type:complete len:1132 (+),score=190.62 TRINITY_DN30256_c0_g1_i1:104-3499(+)